MKKYLLLLIVAFFCFETSFGQGGMWTWISGDSAVGPLGVYGTQGIPSVNNHPPGAYELCEWKDKHGNFWLYGGTYPDNSDLWKYNPLTNEWTWVKGNQLSFQAAVYGSKGISDPANTPGYLYYGCASWTDTSGNLWLFGGHPPTNVLWKYNISLNEWTWVNGDTIAGGIALHGIQGIPAPLNVPGSREEVASSWTDSLNNLWLFGGQGLDDAGNMGMLNDLMKYNISSNEWTWMSGSNLVNNPGNYGIKGVPSPSNAPSSRRTYSKWKDTQSNLWLFGGGDDNGNLYNDAWKYDMSLNEWTWMAGTSLINDSGTYLSNCFYAPQNTPSCRWEHRSSVTDNCGRFWMYGGFAIHGNLVRLSDLSIFDPQQLEWNWISGTVAVNQPGNYGSLGISSPFNNPPSLGGAVAWWGDDNKFYLFGGYPETGYIGHGALWVFTPDSSCIQSCNSSIPLASYQSLDGLLCPGTCTDFINLSFNATSYQWNFFGASPDTSTSVNPQSICYTNPGSYDVQLIASNANGSDTLLLTNYITVYPSPPPQSITQSGDTLFAIAGSASYQWYFNTNLINGATDYFYVAQASGDYNVVATDTNGCEVEAAVFNVIAGIPSTVDSGPLTIFPNPVEDKVKIQIPIPAQLPHSGGAIGIEVKSETTVEISIYNVMGEKVFLAVDSRLLTVDCKLLPSGLYFIEIITAEKFFRCKFVKQ